MNNVESEASLFAVFLLIPRDLLMVEIEKMGGFDLSDGDSMKKLCDKFQVTSTAMTVRLSHLSKSDKKRIGFL